MAEINSKTNSNTQKRNNHEIKYLIQALLASLLLSFPLWGQEDSSDVTAPNRVTEFKAISGDSKVVLSWKNPTDEDFAGTKLIRKEGGYPGSLEDGTQVYDGKETSYTDTKSTNAITFYYTAFAYDKDGNYSSAVPSAQGSAFAIDSKLIYYGVPESYQKPAFVVMKKIAASSPVYQCIIERGLSPKEAEYWLFMDKFNKELRRGFQRVRKEFGYDLIGEKGFIKDEQVPDITDSLIEYMKEKQ